MKKVTMIFAVAFLIFAVASCGSKSTSEEVSADSVEVVEADTVAVTEEVELDSALQGDAIQ
jgi:predicted small lipoprotein YifL